MKPIKLIVKTKSGKYPLIIGRNLIKNLSSFIKKDLLPSKKYLLIVDNNVPKKFISIIEKTLKNKTVNKFHFAANEKNKNQKSVDKILKILLSKNFSREDCLISIGGGITGDVSAFAANLFKRGLQFINIPTTLLAQVDSSIGGKTGINTIHGKNLIGTFYQPKLVISDSEFLKSLSKREIVCGYAEILKHSLIRNKNFFKYLKKNVFKILNLKSPHIEKAIYESCKIKKNIVEKDFKEKGLRKILNFGHTFGHAYEATLGYRLNLNHGEAVILGISSAAIFSQYNKVLNLKEYRIISEHINKINKKLLLRNYFKKNSIKKIIKFMSSDKKNFDNKINLILIKKIGKVDFNYKFNSNKIEKFFHNYFNII